ncbi:hypothetical protein JMJ56_18680 [Belnapia sp. T18]|uniref:Uncharacterized protein n=1 Tax=Belnapia arida TaxID=2804533 RepID=A0ABS1U9V0_9PROT|nr:hypothetical protein [Belnapia arida]MBL6080051.1 hypothetical protein [Belnapia arida]
MPGPMGVSEFTGLVNSNRFSDKDQVLTRQSAMGTAFATVRNFPNRVRQFFGTASARADNRAAVESLFSALKETYGQALSERAILSSRPDIRRSPDGTLVMNSGKPLSIRRTRAILAAAALDVQTQVAGVASRFIPSPPGQNPNLRNRMQFVSDRLFPGVAEHAGVSPSLSPAQHRAYAAMLTERVAAQVRNARAADRDPSIEEARQAAVEILREISTMSSRELEANSIQRPGGAP